MPETLTIHFMHPRDSTSILTATTSSDATVGYLTNALIEVGFIISSAAGYAYRYLDTRTGRQLVEHVPVGDQNVTDGATLYIADQITGAGSMIEILLSVGEILGSGVAGNAAYDGLKATIGNYRSRRAKRKLLNRDEAIAIATELLSIIKDPGMPIDAHLYNNLWVVRVMSVHGVIITICIPPGDPESVSIQVYNCGAWCHP
jgi:hypothetical protein